jgi:hypothetical protein
MKRSLRGTPLRVITKQLELLNSFMTNFIDFLDEGCFRIDCCFSYRCLSPYKVCHRGIFSFTIQRYLC